MRLYMFTCSMVVLETNTFSYMKGRGKKRKTENSLNFRIRFLHDNYVNSMRWLSLYCFKTFSSTVNED